MQASGSCQDERWSKGVVRCSQCQDFPARFRAVHPQAPVCFANYHQRPIFPLLISASLIPCSTSFRAFFVSLAALTLLILSYPVHYQPERRRLMAPTHPNPTTILTLPYEIRRKIYIHVLTKSTSEAIRIVTTNDNGSTHSQGKGRALLHGQPYHCKLDIDSSLLFTCRQINSEANPLLYAGNRFHFINEQSVEHFLGSIGSHNVRLIRRVQVPAYSIRSGSGRWSTERLAIALCGVPNLEEVSICCNVHFGEGDWVDQTDAGRNLVLARTLLRAHNKLELACGCGTRRSTRWRSSL